MNTNLNSGTNSQAPVVSFRGDISRRAGNIRAVTLGGMTINTDHIFGAADTIQESTQDSFGKIANGCMTSRSTTHDAQLEADRNSYQLKDNILNAFGRTRNTSR